MPTKKTKMAKTTKGWKTEAEVRAEERKKAAMAAGFYDPIPGISEHEKEGIKAAKKETLRARLIAPKCNVCGEENCYEHCQVNESGYHVVDDTHLSLADGFQGKDEIVVDVNCKHCGQSGSGIFKKSDIAW